MRAPCTPRGTTRKSSADEHMCIRTWMHACMHAYTHSHVNAGTDKNVNSAEIVSPKCLLRGRGQIRTIAVVGPDSRRYSLGSMGSADGAIDRPISLTGPLCPLLLNGSECRVQSESIPRASRSRAKAKGSAEHAPVSAIKRIKEDGEVERGPLADERTQTSRDAIVARKRIYGKERGEG